MAVSSSLASNLTCLSLMGDWSFFRIALSRGDGGDFLAFPGFPLFPVFAVFPSFLTDENDVVAERLLVTGAILVIRREMNKVEWGNQWKIPVTSNVL